ncbi:MAG: class II aldolase/adducin family protein [Candidatus Latescibacteria bacterium]|nr:class II aldolase/adducin family protein [Candidatus Latescibacterota bacterium]
MNSIHMVKREICEVGRRIYQRGYVAANDGNISVRIAEDRVLCTPTGVSKGFISEDMLCVCDLEGRQVAGHLKISSELRMHLEIYKLRADIYSVVHAHPPTATGFAVAGMDLTQCVLPEVIVSLGGIPLAAYGTPGGPEIFEPMRPLLKEYDAVLMANHGVVTLGRDAMDAHFKMETVEHFARIALVAHQLGAVKTIAPEHVDELIDLRQRFGIKGRPSCRVGDGPAPQPAAGSQDDLVQEITRQVMAQLGKTR